jgi:para-nitrobenzyl esterase
LCRKCGQDDNGASRSVDAPKRAPYDAGIIMRHTTRFRPTLILATLALMTTAPTAHAQRGGALTDPVKVPGGLVSGVPGTHAGITAFRGVPFAAPPVGDRRWRAPQPAPPWPGVRRAEAFGPSCIQQIVQERKPWTYEFMTHGEISEDCLFVNIWTPAKSPSERRPVLVYIYGGANTEGSGMVPVYDGEGLASKGLVVVNFNYRVGVLGFLAHPELSKEASYHASGNYGLLDQIAAVKWVRENIAGFGGDPERITIAGQSAGGQGVHNLTASPLAKGTFHRAIIESAGGNARPLADAEADGLRFAEAKGAATLADLRAKSWQEIVAPVPAPATAGGRGGGNLRFGVVVDGYALPAPVSEIFAQGRQNDVPTLTGNNADEGGAMPQPTITAADFDRQARQRYGEDADAFLKLYPAPTDDAAKVAQNQSARDLARTTLYVWAINRGKTAKTKAYTYFWNHVLPGPDAAQYGAFHTSEVPYVLNALERSDRPFTDVDRAIAGTISSYWVNFATSGDPNGEGLPAWPVADGKTWMTMELSERPHAIPVADSPAKQAFLERVLSRR